MSFRYTIVPKYQSCKDIREELKNVCKLRAKHESICQSFDKWQILLKENSSQLEILNDTAISLRGRHKMLTDALALKPNDPVKLKRLQHEINVIEAQIFIWIRELSEINDNRFLLDFNYALEDLRLRVHMQRSMTNIELAHIDIDFLQNNHQRFWVNFLKSKENRESKNF